MKKVYTKLWGSSKQKFNNNNKNFGLFSSFLMFTFFTGLWSWYFSPQEICLLLLGLDNAGKTTTLEYLKYSHKQKHLHPSRIVPTVGLNVGTFPIAGVEVTVWDLGGQMALRSIWRRYYEECRGIVFVVDMTDEMRINEAIDCLISVLISLGHLPVIILANKQDVARPGDDVQIIRTKAEFEYKSKLDELGRSHEDFPKIIEIFGVSARNGTGISEAIGILVNEVTRCPIPTREQPINLY